jgi:Ca-activated chloride channel family protein
MMAEFHFLRPHMLWLLIPVGLILIAQLHQQDLRTRWLKVMAPALLDALLINRAGESKSRPVYLFACTAALGIFALAGPAWQREQSPFTEDLASLVIVLKVTTSMEAEDLQPMRIERSVHKIRDLLELRSGARTALISYAGSAHLVMPLTSDATIIESFAAELSPELMPLEGNNVEAALSLAGRVLEESGQPGSVLLITDDLDPAQMRLIKEQRVRGAAAPVILGALDLQRSPGEAERLTQGASALGSEIEFISPDDADVRAIIGQLESHLNPASNPDNAERWRDAGYLITPLLALLTLVWFRRGWLMSWEV